MPRSSVAPSTRSASTSAGRSPKSGSSASARCCRSTGCTRRSRTARSSAAPARSRSSSRSRATCSAAAVSRVVGVHPTHRRRGVLRAMMDTQLRDIHEREEPIAALWASEETIYGRFGYGLAAWCGEINLERVWNAYARPLERRGRVRFVTPEEAARLFPPVWDALMRERPGVFQRTKAWWELRRAADPRRGEGESEALRRARARRLCAGVRDLPPASELRRRRRRMRRLEVSEAIGTTPQATAEIWRFLLDIDWYATIEAARCCPPTIRSSRCSRIRAARVTGWVTRCGCASSTSVRRSPGASMRATAASSSTCTTPCARGTRVAGSSRAARRRERTPRQISRSTSSELGLAYLGAVSFAQLRDGLRVEELVGRGGGAGGCDLRLAAAALVPRDLLSYRWSAVGRALRLVAAAAAALICAAPAAAHTDGGSGLSLEWPASGTITRGFGYDGAEWHPGHRHRLAALARRHRRCARRRRGDRLHADVRGLRQHRARRHGRRARGAVRAPVGGRRDGRRAGRDRAAARPRRLHGLLHGHAPAFRGCAGTAWPSIPRRFFRLQSPAPEGG